MTREEAIKRLEWLLSSSFCKYLSQSYSEALGMAIAALSEQEPVTNRNGLNGWISVEDRLPEEWEDVLVWSKCGFVACALYIGIPGKWRVSWNHEMLEPDTITHWMPLPEPPEVPEQ